MAIDEIIIFFSLPLQAHCHVSPLHAPFHSLDHHLLIVQLLFHFTVGHCDFSVRYLLKNYYQIMVMYTLDDSMIWHSSYITPLDLG